jgi:hypothetical protein
MIALIRYPQSYAVELSEMEFSVLRENRDVIKMGRFRMWDAGPGPGCPVRDHFFRRTGLRVFTTNRLTGN